MGFLNKAIDKITKSNTTYLPYNKLAELVKTHFIVGGKPEYLKKVAKAVKGKKPVDSISRKYILMASDPLNFFKITALFNPKRNVMIQEAGTKNYYQLDAAKN